MSQTILIVDDAVPQHKLISVLLEEQSIKTFSAYSGASALTLAASIKPDLVLLDIDMPEMNGFDVCRLMKLDPATAEIPIIFLTASTSMDEKMCGFALQAVDYITKPFDPEELCARVRVALRTKRLLDLLPKTPAAVTEPVRGSGAQHLNARLSMAHLMRSRSENPWNRTPPPRNDLSHPVADAESGQPGSAQSGCETAS